MGTLLSYSIASSIILACLYLTYRWTMANERQFSLNRVTLYLIYALSLFSAIGYAGIANSFSSSDVIVSVNEVSDAVPDFKTVETTTVITEEEKLPTWISVVLWIYIVGICVTAIRFCSSLVKIAAIIWQGDMVGSYGKHRLIVSAQENLAPFSCLRYIVISKDDYQRSFSTILTHEMTHLRSCHWIDLMVANIMAIFQWFNPAAWLMIEEFKTVHEYQADESVIRSGADIKSYQYLLIEKAVGERLPSPANSLNHSKLKKRVTMMYKSKPRTMRRVASLATIPALIAGIALVNSSAVASILSDTENADLLPISEAAAVLPSAVINSEGFANEEISNRKVMKNWVDTQVSELKNTGSEASAASSDAATAVETSVSEPTMEAAQPAADGKKKDEVYVSVEEMAEYPGGTGELMKFLAMNIRYPENAVKNDVQGRVIVKFIISKTGKVEDPVVVKGVDPELDAEAIRVVKKMPDWVPAKNGGKPVDSYFNLPVSFKLQNDTPKDSTTNK